MEAAARVERLKLKMCFTLLVLPGFMKIYIEGTHVSAHMYICPDFRLIFYHDPCNYSVCSLVLFLCYPRRRYIFYLAAYLCPDDELFDARFIFVNYADVMNVCKSFEPGCSAPNLRHASFLLQVNRPFKSLHVARQDQTNLPFSFFFCFF